MMRGYYGGFGWIGMLLLCIIILFGIFYAIFGENKRGLNCNSNHQHQKTSPLEELKNRYAKGEITKKEFEEIKNDIK